MKRLLPLLLALWIAVPASAQMWPFPGPGRAGGPITQWITGGSTTSTSTSATTVYSFPGGSGTTAFTSTEAQSEMVVLDGTISDLKVRLSANIGDSAGDAITFRVRHCPGASACGDASTDTFCTITDGDADETSCTFNSGSFTVAAGDRLTMQITTANTPVAVVPSWGFKWVSSETNIAMLATSHNHTTAATGYGIPFDGSWTTGQTTVTNAECPAPANYTVVGMYVKTSVAISTGCNRITLMKNGAADTGCSGAPCFLIDLTGGASAGSDTSGSLTWNTDTSAPDLLNGLDDPGTTCGGTGNGTNTWMATTLKLQSTAGTYPLMVSPAFSFSVSAVSWAYPYGMSQLAQTTESARQRWIRALTQRGFALKLTAAPGSGKSWAFTLRDDGADAFGCSIADTATKCGGVTGSTAISEGSLLSVQGTPSGTPSTGGSGCAAWAATVP